MCKHALLLIRTCCTFYMYVVNTATFKLVGQPSQFRYRDNCERSELSSVFNGPEFRYICDHVCINHLYDIKF